MRKWKIVECDSTKHIGMKYYYIQRTGKWGFPSVEIYTETLEGDDHPTFFETYDKETAVKKVKELNNELTIFDFEEDNDNER